MAKSTKCPGCGAIVYASPNKGRSSYTVPATGETWHWDCWMKQKREAA